jgi:superfamily II DNA or RNA helicase
VKSAVFDEVHRCKATDSLNAEMLIAARRQGLRVIGLSATAGDSPLDFKALGYALGLHELDSGVRFWTWVRRWNCRPSPHGGFYFAGKEDDRKRVMARLNEEIFPEHGVRVRRADLGSDFPECQICPEAYDLPDGKKLDALYAEMSEALEALKTASNGDANSEHPLTRLLRARQQIEILKVPAFVSLAEDALAQGHSVALFINFTQTLHELCARLKTSCKIDGSQSGPEREDCISAFQAGRERVIVINSRAGGIAISLHDTRGDAPRLGIVSPDFSAVNLRQVLGRLARDGGKSKSLYRIVFAARTEEEKVLKKVTMKLNQIDALNDGDLVP